MGRLGLVTFAAALVAAAPAGASLGADWGLDEGHGATAHDASGHGNTGTITGAAWTAGRFGSALHFDGDGDGVKVAHSPTLEPPAVTVEGWVRAGSSPGPFRHIASAGASQCIAASYGLYTGTGGGLAFYISDGTSTVALSPEMPATVWDGAWHHVAGTYDGANVRLYVDGAQVGGGTPASLAIGYGTPTPDFLLGLYGGPCTDAHDYAGDLDEIRVWDRALGAGELAASASMGAGSADKLAVSAGGPIVYTSHFGDRKRVTIGLESGTGSERIASVKIVDALPLGAQASCGKPLSNHCVIALSNGGRTAVTAVKPGLIPAIRARLRIKLASGKRLIAEVPLKH